MCVQVPLLGCVQHFATPRAVAAKLLCPWNFPGKKTRVGCDFLFQGIFLTQESNLCLLHLLHSLPLCHLGIVYTLQYIYVNSSLPIHPPSLSPLGVHTFILYICVCVSALQVGSSILFV